MGRDVLSRTTYNVARDKATKGGTVKATHAAEEKIRNGKGLDPMVDPKGPAHIGPVRLSLPRFEQVNNLWQLTKGLPMAIETLFDTTGSMGDNVEIAFNVLPHDYEMLTTGDNPILGRYDVQMANAIFNDTEDGSNVAVLARSQFEMAEKIAIQLAMLPPGRLGCGNGKEDPQFGLFGAAYLTRAAINRWGLRYYHFTVSDEPILEYIELPWLKRIFGNDVIKRAKENDYDFTENLPDTAQVVRDLQSRAHAFFLQVDDRKDVRDQWTGLYGAEHVIKLPDGTQYLHFVKATIIGLTEGILDLKTAKKFLVGHEVGVKVADRIIRAVSHIPLGAQTLVENFNRIPLAGTLFKEKTDLWPVDPKEITASGSTEPDGSGPNWL